MGSRGTRSRQQQDRQKERPAKIQANASFAVKYANSSTQSRHVDAGAVGVVTASSVIRSATRKVIRIKIGCRDQNCNSACRRCSDGDSLDRGENHPQISQIHADWQRRRAQ